jgi:Peptidase M50B-like
MNRLHQFVLIAATLGASWLGMQAVHELGHVLGAILSGGKVAQVVLHPATISYTRLAENPNPQLVTWLGPLVGIALPLVAVAIARSIKWPGWYVVQFFAGFCLVANSAYLAFGSFRRIGDAGDLLRHGTPVVLLWLFGLITIPIGVRLWNDLGPYFGLGESLGQVNRITSYAVLGIFVAMVAIEMTLS